MTKTKEYTEEDFNLWLELDWLTLDEAFCVLMGFPPRAPEHVSIALRLSEYGQHVLDLQRRAVADNVIEGLTREGGSFSGYYRAPFRSWLKWGITKSSIHLDESLLEAAGLKEKESVEEHGNDQPNQKTYEGTVIVQTTQILLLLCPKIRVADIIAVLTATKSLKKVPGDKTIRNHLRSAGIVLSDTKPTKEEVALIEKTLAPFYPKLSS